MDVWSERAKLQRFGRELDGVGWDFVQRDGLWPDELRALARARQPQVRTRRCVVAEEQLEVSVRVGLTRLNDPLGRVVPGDELGECFGDSDAGDGHDAEGPACGRICGFRYLAGEHAGVRSRMGLIDGLH